MHYRVTDGPSHRDFGLLRSKRCNPNLVTHGVSEVRESK